MLYPTATNFDDLFYEALPTSGSLPTGWQKAWVFDDPEEDNGSIASALLGHYCKISNGLNLWVHAREHLLDTLKGKLLGIPGDDLYYSIIHKGNIAIVAINHQAISGRKLIARIAWDSVPHQKVLTPPA